MRSALLITMIFVLLSCSKADQVNNQFIDGTYKGIFTRGTDTANIEIVFKDGLFSGKSDKPFPVICNGQILQQKDVISFTNTCNTSSLLIGPYYYYLKDNYLSFWKSENGVAVYYKLNK